LLKFAISSCRFKMSIVL
jgi:charged multivesicular body protein 1